MKETLDETSLKRKLLRELQAEMAGRRGGGLKDLMAPEVSEDAPTDERDEGAPLDPGSVVRESELDEPRDVKGRLGRLLRTKGY